MADWLAGWSVGRLVGQSEHVTEQLFQVNVRVREQVLTLGILDDGLVTKHILVTHLYALSSLESNLVDRVLDLHRFAVLQPIDADVDCTKCTW